MTELLADPVDGKARAAGQESSRGRACQGEYAGDRSANASVAALYDAVGPAVLGYLRAQGAAEPEDLLGEVFLQVTRDLPRFRGPDGALRRWVFTIARHRLIDDRRRRAVRPRTCASEPPERPAAGPEGATVLDPQLVQALKSLTPLQREVVVLRFVADLSLRDVARMTRRPVGAVKAVQARALVRLAHELTGTAVGIQEQAAGR
jgi:RNA polymerase sigma factor (sigma-70 family)